MHSINRIALGVVALIAGVTSSLPIARAQDPGLAAINRYGCAHCHAVTGARSTPQVSCVQCHEATLARPRGPLTPRPHIEHFITVPSLERAGSRLRRDYLESYIRDPHDVRPRIDESMPRLPVTSADARAIANYLARVAPVRAPASPAPSASRVARGAEIYATQCGTCHAFGNVRPSLELPPEALRVLGVAVTLAPNLRYARERLDPDVALAWITDPTSVDPASHMPNPQLPREDALAVRDFIFLGSPGPAVQPPSVPDLSALVDSSRRSVRYVDVRRILGRSCVHCHATSSGTMSTTALGFPAMSLDLATYAGIRAGATDAAGQRHSIIESQGGAPPILLARLVQRHREAQRDRMALRADTLSPAARTPPTDDIGMPLGLPPVSLADLRTIATWIAAGAPE